MAHPNLIVSISNQKSLDHYLTLTQFNKYTESDLLQLGKPLLKNIAEFGAGFTHSKRPISGSCIELIGAYCPSIVPFESELSRMIASKTEKTKHGSGGI
jgi:hypothetical protein